MENYLDNYLDDLGTLMVDSDGLVIPLPQLDPLGELYRSTVPLPGRPGWRADRAGREWYSAAWLDEARS